MLEPGHQDFPWNEAVDSISRHFAKESNAPPALPEGPVRALSYTVDAEWPFARLLDPSTTSYLRFNNDGFHFNVAKQKAALRKDIGKVELPVSRAPTKVNYKVATFNNVSICGGEDTAGKECTQRGLISGSTCSCSASTASIER
eukprot:601501-Pyramimonas_sp.AAC.1